MYNHMLFVGMNVHKENFSLCCYDMMQDKIFYTQKLESDYRLYPFGGTDETRIKQRKTMRFSAFSK